MVFSRYAAKWITQNRALEAQEERRNEAKAWEERRLNAVGLSKLPRPDCVTMLDMAYLSGKIYEDPETDPAYICILPDGKSLFDNCSLMLKSWHQQYKIYNNGNYELPEEQQKLLGQMQENKFKKFVMNFAHPGAGPDSRAMPSEMRKSLELDAKNEANILNAEIDKNFEKVREINKSYIINNVKTYFKAAIYVNRLHRCSVLAIRGTVLSEVETFFADVGFATNTSFVIRPMYEQALRFYREVGMSNNKILRENPIVACTGHSLGGIIAKMIAPVTGLSTYTFNSPGVKPYLRNNKLQMGILANQEIVTFYAKGDWIGNFHREMDFGTHIPLSVLGSKDIKYKDIPSYMPGEGGLTYVFEKFMTYHAMVDIFNHLNETAEGRKYVTKRIKYEK